MLRIFDKMSPMAPSTQRASRHDAAPEVTLAPARVKLPPSRPLVFEAVDSLGRVNETLRDQCNTAARKVASLISLDEDLSSIFDGVRSSLQRLETTTSELRQANGALTEAQDQTADLRGRLNALRSENEKNKNANQVMMAEAEQNGEALRLAEARLESATDQKYEFNHQIGDLETRLASEQLQTNRLRGELEQVQERQVRTEQSLSNTQLLLAEEQHRLVIVTEQNRTLNAALSDNKVQLAKIGASFSDLQFAHENDRHRLSTLETEIQTQRDEGSTWRGLYQTEQERSKASSSAFQIENDTLGAQLTRSEQAIAEALGLVQGKTDALRRAERKLEEAATRVSGLEMKLGEGQAALSEAASKMLDCEIARAALVARVKPLIQAMRSKNGALRRAQHEVRVLAEQLDADAQRHERELNDQAARVHTLSDQLENERVRRDIAESALYSVRELKANLPDERLSDELNTAPEIKRAALAT